MKAMVLTQAASLKDVPHPLRLVEMETPVPEDDELLLRISTCGVYHTELDEIEGRLKPSRLPIVLGYEIVGRVVERGKQAMHFNLDDRVGVGWIHRSDGSPSENLAAQFTATGCDAHGGYAEFTTVPAAYAVAIPDNLTDVQAAPLLCAGAIGYRALRLTGIRNGEPLGLMGLGGSGHLVLPTAKHLFPDSPVFIFVRDESVQQFALKLGADWAGGVDAAPPQRLQAIIDTTPAWKPVVASLAKLRPGGRLVINAIRKEDTDKEELLKLCYHEHLWMEREIKSVANLTHADIAEFLPQAATIPLTPQVTTYPLELANDALRALREGKIKGANVLTM